MAEGEGGAGTESEPDGRPGGDLGAERDAVLAEAAAATSRAADLQAAVDQLTRQLDVYGLDLQRMRKTVIQLRETQRALREGQAAGVADAGTLNAAMAAEIEALRLERQADLAEMEAIIAALKPLTAEVQDA
jgi:transposase-like protein